MGDRSKGDTLQSQTSNIYEDLVDTSSENGSEVSLNPDVYSDFLDETFENAESVKGMPEFIILDYIDGITKPMSCFLDGPRFS